MSAKLYDRKLIRTGTILSVFIATSDEAIIILLSDGSKALSVLPLIGLKLLLAVVVGYAANAFLKHERLDRTEEPIGACCEECDDCARVGNGFIERYILTPLYHSLKIFFFILAVNLVFGVILYFAGEDQISAFLQRGYVFQPFLTALVGLIPNWRQQRHPHADVHFRRHFLRRAVRGVVFQRGAGAGRALQKSEKSQKELSDGARALYRGYGGGTDHRPFFAVWQYKGGKFPSFYFDRISWKTRAFCGMIEQRSYIK